MNLILSLCQYDDNMSHYIRALVTLYEHTKKVCNVPLKVHPATQFKNVNSHMCEIAIYWSIL